MANELTDDEKRQLNALLDFERKHSPPRPVDEMTDAELVAFYVEVRGLSVALAHEVVDAWRGRLDKDRR